MAYEKQQWDTTSFVNPTRMNHIEEGIKANSDEVASLNNDLANTKKDVSDLNSNLTAIGGVEIGDAEATIGNNLYKKVIVYDGTPNGAWKSISGLPSGAKNIRIDYGLSYILFDGCLYPINSIAVGSDVRFNIRSGDLQFYVQGSAIVHAVIFIIYNK